MIYWKGKKFWVGKLFEHPEIMTQGKTLKELEENMKEAYILMTMDDVPQQHEYCCKKEVVRLDQVRKRPPSRKTSKPLANGRGKSRLR